MAEPRDSSTRLRRLTTGPEKADLVKLLELHNTNRIDYNNRKWETIKLFEGAIVILMAATLGALAAAWREAALRDSVRFNVVLAALPVLAAFAAVLGYKNLQRESRLLFREEYQIFKLARMAGLDVMLEDEDCWLKDDKHLLMDKWRSSTKGTKSKGKEPATLDEWLDARMGGHVFADLFRLFFLVQALIALLVAGSVAFIGTGEPPNNEYLDSSVKV